MTDNSENRESFIHQLEEIINQRKNESPESSYTASLMSRGLDKILQKVGEESVEFILDAKNNNPERIISEGADLMYHFLVSLCACNLSIHDIENELRRRHET